MRSLSLLLPFLACVASAAPRPSAPAKAVEPPSVPARPAPDSEPVYDTTRARALYQDGDFERAIRIVETGLKKGHGLTHSDSVFIFKHLGVMYAASENTRERGKYYMVQLLSIEPTARIMDMYASDMIYMIFRNIQEEFATAQRKLDRAESNLAGNRAAQGDTLRPARPASGGTRPEPPPRETGSWRPWVIGGTAVLAIGAGVAVYFLTQDSGPGKTSDTQVE